MLYRLFKNLYSPALMVPAVRGAVLVVFLGWICSSVAVVPYIDVGLDQELSMPSDSYMLKSFKVGEVDCTAVLFRFVVSRLKHIDTRAHCFVMLREGKCMNGKTSSEYE